MKRFIPLSILLILLTISYAGAETKRNCISGDCENGNGVEETVTDNSKLRFSGSFVDGGYVNGELVISEKVTVSYSKGIGYEKFNRRWQYLGELYPDSYHVFIDTETIKIDKNNAGKISKVNVWNKVVTKENDVRLKDNIVLNCLENTYIVNGPLPSPIPPDSMIEAIASTVCK